MKNIRNVFKLKFWSSRYKKIGCNFSQDFSWYRISVCLIVISCLSSHFLLCFQVCRYLVISSSLWSRDVCYLFHCAITTLLWPAVLMTSFLTFWCGLIVWSPIALSQFLSVRSQNAIASEKHILSVSFCLF